MSDSNDVNRSTGAWQRSHHGRIDDVPSNVVRKSKQVPVSSRSGERT